MTRSTKAFSVSEFECDVECAPKQHPANKSAKCEESEAERRSRRAEDRPAPQQPTFQPLHRAYSLPAGLKPSSLISLKWLSISGCTFACGTWHSVQKYRRGDTSASI